MVAKYVVLIVLNGIVLSGITAMIEQKAWGLMAGVLISIIALDVVYFSPRRFIPGKYLVPGTIFLVFFAVFPVIYTLYISFTNYGTGNILSKPTAVTTIQLSSLEPPTATSKTYGLQVMAEGGVTGPIAFFLTDPATSTEELGLLDGLQPVDPAKVKRDADRVTGYGDYVSLNLSQANDRTVIIEAFAVPTGNGTAIRAEGFRKARELRQRLQFDSAADTMTDTVTGTVYRPKDGYFVSEAGEQLTPGWRTVIGLGNFQKVFNDPNIRDPFIRVFIWTFLFALLSVVVTFTLGLLLAMVFNSPKMKLKPMYRSLVIIPYALPSFMTALVWKGMLNDTFGVVNRYLDTLFGITVPWLSDPFWAKVSLLLVNLWLGFPYMFLICTGALQGIPTDLTEAARVDGATGAKAFRKVTFPLLLVAVSPLLISSFAFNFNNFNLVKLLTNGGPPFSGGSSAGQTDILISYTYNLAFGSARGADYGLASAISVFIFIVVAAISAISFKFTRTFEEVK